MAVPAGVFSVALQFSVRYRPSIEVHAPSTMPEVALPEEPIGLAARDLKVPPHSIEAEQSVLGGLLLDNAAWERVGDMVVEEDFYRRDHRLIFAAIRGLADSSQPFDAVTAAGWLDAQGALADAGGLVYLGELARGTPSAANITAYADIVRERAILRAMIRVGTDIANDAFQPEGRRPIDLLDRAEQRVFEIAERGERAQAGFAPIRDVLVQVMDRIDTLFQRGDPITGVATGFDDLDLKTSGLQPGDLIIVAGRPSMGKTSFAGNLIEQAAIKGKLTVAMFSMEMPAEQLTMRMLSSLGRIDQHKVRTGRLEDADWPRLTSALTILNETQIFVDDTPALTPTELRARCRRLKREHGLGLVVVDYLQLMHIPGTRENRATEISEISRTLKALAKELSVPIVAVSQLNRSLESRNDKRPIMSDLRESGAIEQDSDLILFIYRDEVYNEDTEHKGKAEIIIAKQRNGPIGKVILTFLGQHTRFENYMPEDFSGARF